MENNALFIQLLCGLKEIIYIKNPCLALNKDSQW